MDVRAKLIEILNSSFEKQYEKRCLLTAPHTAEDLIAHGVTVQEWISVTERLPDCDMFLGISWFEDKVRIYQKRAWDKDFVVGGLNIRKDIRYWMPIPDQPKGE